MFFFSRGEKRLRSCGCPLHHAIGRIEKTKQSRSSAMEFAWCACMTSRQVGRRRPKEGGGEKYSRTRKKNTDMQQGQSGGPTGANQRRDTTDEKQIQDKVVGTARKKEKTKTTNRRWERGNNMASLISSSSSRSTPNKDAHDHGKSS